MQASSAIAAMLNPFAAPTSGQAAEGVGATLGADGADMGLGAGADQAQTDASGFGEMLAGLLGAACLVPQAQPANAPAPNINASAVQPDVLAAQAPVLLPAGTVNLVADPEAATTDETAAEQTAGLALNEFPGGRDGQPSGAGKAIMDVVKATLAKTEAAPAAVKGEPVPAPQALPTASKPAQVVADAAATAALTLANAQATQETAPASAPPVVAQAMSAQAASAAAKPSDAAKPVAKDKTSSDEIRTTARTEAAHALASPAKSFQDAAVLELAASASDAPAPDEAPLSDDTVDAPAIQTAALTADVRTDALTGPREGARATSQTVAHLAAQIANKIDGRTTRFDVQLDPHGLGRVDVRVEIGPRGDISAALSFDNPQAAAELRGRASELQSALEQAGFDLSKTSLSFNSGGEGRHQGLWDQHKERAEGHVWHARAFTDLSDTPEAAPALVRQRAATGVDVRI